MSAAGNPAGAGAPAATVTMDAALLQRLRTLCASDYPKEACGALLGTGDGFSQPWNVLSVESAPNQHADDQARRYLVPPEFQLHAEKLARQRGHEVLGFYHSHPDHPARPSEYDRAHAWAGYLYVICAVARGSAGDLGAFTLDAPEGRFVQVALVETGASPSLR